MRIALVSPYSWSHPGGVTRHIEALAAELSAAGHEPRVIAPFDGEPGERPRLAGLARPDAGLAVQRRASNIANTPLAARHAAARAARRAVRRRPPARAGRAARPAG